MARDPIMTKKKLVSQTFTKSIYDRKIITEPRTPKNMYNEKGKEIFLLVLEGHQYFQAKISEGKILYNAIIKIFVFGYTCK